MKPCEAGDGATVPANQSDLIAASWSAAAEGYAKIFVKQFAPWTASCLAALRVRAPSLALVSGPVWVPGCGPGQELSLLDHVLNEPVRCAPETRRSIVAVDVAPGMVRIATKKASEIGPHVSVHVGDAMHPPAQATCSAIFSVFLLQQLPDPLLAVSRWVKALAPGGVLVLGK